MIGQEAYRIWSRAEADPDGSGPMWSRWTKPVLFIGMTDASLVADGAGPPLTAAPGGEGGPPPPEFWSPEADPQQAIVVDVPGDVAVRYGVHLARLGYWPVPLFNGCPGPRWAPRVSSTRDVQPIVTELLRGAGRLLAMKTHAHAPPAFLLDWDRMKGGRPSPGEFDNRWVVLPQDMPSAAYLGTWNIGRVMLIQPAGGQPQDDLAHVLRRWQDAGIQIQVKHLGATDPPKATEVARPSWFRSLCRAAAVLVRLRRNSTGGFGAPVPLPSEGGSTFGGARFG